MVSWVILSEGVHCKLFGKLLREMDWDVHTVLISIDHVPTAQCIKRLDASLIPFYCHHKINETSIHKPDLFHVA